MAVTISYHTVLLVIKEIGTMEMSFGVLVAQEKVSFLLGNVSGLELYVSFALTASYIVKLGPWFIELFMSFLH